MRIRFNPLWLLVSVLILPWQYCQAQAPQGEFSYDFGGDLETALWDITGNYDLDLFVVDKNGTETEVQLLGVNMTQDAHGNLSGADTTGLLFGPDGAFSANYKISGKVTGRDGFARVKFVIRIKGIGSMSGRDDINYSMLIAVEALVDAGSGQLIGIKPAKVSAHFAGWDGFNGDADFSTPLPDNVDGTWNLTLHISALKKLFGTATITTSTGATLNFILSGNYNGFDSKIKLIGGGLKEKVSLSPIGNSFSGKLFGQTEIFPFD